MRIAGIQKQWLRPTGLCVDVDRTDKLSDRSDKQKIVKNQPGSIFFEQGSIKLGADLPMGPSDVETLLGAFNQQPHPSPSPLAGRTTVFTLTLPSIGGVVVKPYRRGGFIQRLFSDRYLYFGRRRCRMEYDMLQRVRRLNVKAARPLAWAYEKRLLYRCWLVTELIPSSLTLADLSHSDPAAAKRYTWRTSEQIRILIRHRILHVDLHPGNVLVGTDGQVHLIDFDRARRYRRSTAALGRRYRSRWQRAVRKHRLPEILITAMEAGLVEQSRTAGEPGKDR